MRAAASPSRPCAYIVRFAPGLSRGADPRVRSRLDARFLRVPVLRPLVFLRPPLDFRFDGTFAPFFRASESPIAIACFLLVTLPPVPPRPRRNCSLLLSRARHASLQTCHTSVHSFLRPPSVEGGSCMHAGRMLFCEAKAAPAIAFDVVLLARGIACRVLIAVHILVTMGGRPVTADARRFFARPPR